jgi:hypothetical protein
MEYSFNYDVPNNPGDPDPASGGNGSWQLVRDWYVGAGGATCNGATAPWSTMADHPASLTWVEQLSNGHVYATVYSDYPTSAQYMVELPASGTSTMRFINQMPVNGTRKFYAMKRDGSQIYMTQSGTGRASTLCP